MLSRKEQKGPGNSLPEEWKKEVEKLLEVTYQEKCNILKKKFEVYGFSYPNEILIAASFLDSTDQGKSPMTVLVSSDLKDGQNHKKLLNTLVDAIGIFFDNYFSTPDWSEWQMAWQKESIKEVTFHYKITRENVSLTIMANKILNGDDINE
ncbi:MAG: hypothetical protein KAQ98_09760 [Bacteriovoracaceae bacterium]|nr:hypothetical protein [Bacteriovoracaceae bacterium]